MAPRLELLKPFLRPYRWRLAILILSLLGVATFEGLGVGMLFPLIEYVQLGDAFQSQGRSARIVFKLLGAWGISPSVGLFIVLILAVVAGLLLLKFCVARVTVSICEPLGEDLRNAAFRAVVLSHLFYFYDRSSGALINVLEDEVDYVSAAITFSVITLTSSISMALYVAFVLAISWKLTLLMGLIAALRYGAAGLFFRASRRLNAEQAGLRAQLKSYLVGIHQGIELVKTYGATSREIQRFEAGSRRIRENADAISLTAARTQFSDGLLGEGLLCILVYLAISVIHLPGTALLTFLVIATRIIPKVTALNDARVRLNEHIPRIIELPAVISGRALRRLEWGPVETRNFERELRFEGVSFSYPDGKLPSLVGIDLVIRKNETLAVVGESGSGKSTLAKLALRLFDPTQGRILVDGVPLPQVREEDWHRLVAVVSQDTFIFDDTVERNVRYGAEEASDEQMWTALRHARAEEFVNGLPEGLKTRLGERGVRLSGGQRQRIAIARAFLRGAPFLILDEATSAMDAVTEKQIHDAVMELAHGRTVMVIAHRFTTVREARRIVVLEKGRITAAGTHEELIARPGQYRRFCELQGCL